MLERECNPHGSSKQASTPGRVQAREHLSRASKSARVQGANHRFKDCRQIELATEASKNESANYRFRDHRHSEALWLLCL